VKNRVNKTPFFTASIRRFLNPRILFLSRQLSMFPAVQALPAAHPKRIQEKPSQLKTGHPQRDQYERTAQRHSQNADHDCAWHTDQELERKLQNPAHQMKTEGENP
jgi:hypothetical protein